MASVTTTGNPREKNVGIRTSHLEITTRNFDASAEQAVLPVKLGEWLVCPEEGGAAVRNIGGAGGEVDGQGAQQTFKGLAARCVWAESTRSDTAALGYTRIPTLYKGSYVADFYLWHLRDSATNFAQYDEVVLVHDYTDPAADGQGDKYNEPAAGTTGGRTVIAPMLHFNGVLYTAGNDKLEKIAGKYAVIGYVVKAPSAASATSEPVRVFVYDSPRSVTVA